MKLLFITFYMLSATYMYAQDSTRFRVEATTSLATLQTTDQSAGGFQFRQQLTYFPTPRVGVALGFGWGLQNVPGPANSRDLAGLAQVYHRNLSQADLSLVLRPVTTRRHIVSFSLGIASLKQTTTRVDSVYLNSNLPSDVDPVRVRVARTEGRAVAPVVGASYQFRVSPRWAVGAEGRLMWGPGGQRISTPGLLGTYRFKVTGESLGFLPVATDELRWGVRMAVNASGSYERSPAEVWLPRVAGGAWAQVPLGINWQMRGELSLVGRGVDGRRLETGNTTYLAVQERSTFVDATLLFSTEITENWRAFLGPNLSFLVAGQRQQSGNLSPVEGGINSGLVLGTSVRLSRRVALDARYVRDIIQFSRNPYNGYQGFQLGTSIQLSK